MNGDARVLHHVCLRVADLGRSEVFYAGRLKLKKLWEFRLQAEHAQVLFGLPRDCDFVVYDCPPGRLELFTTPGEQAADPLGQHWCLLVSERDALAEALKREGIPSREIVREDRRIVFVQDPDGHWLELKPRESV